MEKIIIKNLKLIISLLFCFLYYIKTSPNLNLDAKFPISLTLHDDKILLITENKIIFYNSSLTSIIKSYDLSESEIALDFQETFKTMACQYPQEYKSYILVFVKDQLYFFDKNGNKITKENFTALFNDQPYYEIIPIKENENYLYYIISATMLTTPIKIKFLYYHMNINTKENFLILEKEYLPLTIASAYFTGISENAACVLMNSNVQNNILTCFYSGTYPCQISITSFSLENENMIKLSSYSKDISFTTQEYLSLFRVKTNDDKSKAYIVFATYELGGYSAIYDINSNEL